MSKFIKTLLLSGVYLTVIASGCRTINFQPRSENEVIRLDKREPSPVAKDGNFKSGDQVAVIKPDGEITFNEKVAGTCGELALVRRNFNGAEEWKPSENGRPENFSPDSETIEKISPKGYKFEYGERRKFDKCYPSEAVFRAPWTNNINLKIGDTVYRDSVGFSNGEKGVVSEVPVERFGNFRVRFGDQKDSTEVSPGAIFSSIQPAKQEDLSPGTFVHYIYHGWAIVVGKRDNKIIIREANSHDDIIVDVSKLQILRYKEA